MLHKRKSLRIVGRSDPIVLHSIPVVFKKPQITFERQTPEKSLVKPDYDIILCTSIANTDDEYANLHALLKSHDMVVKSDGVQNLQVLS